MTDRREFLGHATASVAALTGLTAVPTHVAAALGIGVPVPAEAMDTSWMQRVKGKYRAVFDVPEVESGFGAWRAPIWAGQVQEAFKATPADIGTVIVLRHNAIILAMAQPFWDKYAVGQKHNVTHPLTGKPTDRNPVLMSSSRGEVDAPYDGFALDKSLARGTIVLACNLALEHLVIPGVAEADKVSVDEARTRVHAALVPGVIVQPSGGFAAIAAQDVGCRYLRAS